MTDKKQRRYDQAYLKMAMEWSKLSHCKRKQVGALIVKDKIQWVECDILDVKGLEKAMDGVQQIYHAAAMVSFEAKHRKRMHQVNIQGTANVVNMALENNIEKLVHVSSIAALGRRKR